jgi:hypothetical protein
MRAFFANCSRRSNRPARDRIGKVAFRIVERGRALRSTKIAQPEPRRRSALLSRAVVATSSAGVALSRSGPRKRAVR